MPRRTFETGVLVIGGGMAAAMAELSAREEGADVLLVDKSYFGQSGCAAHASGVFPVFFPDEDDVDAWLNAWGGVLCNRELLRKALTLSSEFVRKMEQWGVR